MMGPYEAALERALDEAQDLTGEELDKFWNDFDAYWQSVDA